MSVYYRNLLSNCKQGVAIFWNPDRVVTFVFDRDTMIVLSSSAGSYEYIGKPLEYASLAMGSIMKWPCAEIRDNEYGSQVIL